MSRHRKGTGKHRKATKPQNLTAPTALTISALMGAWASLVSAGHGNVATAEFNPGRVKPVAEQLPVAPPRTVIRQAVNSQANIQPAQQMLVASVPLVGGVGLTQRASILARYIQTHYPSVKSIGGVRPDPIPDHPSGRAIDIMVYGNRALGDAIAKDVLAQANTFGVKYLIWQETYETPSGYAHWMADRGSPTANHFDHVHVTVW